MRWPRRNITIAVSAAAVIGLVASLVAVLLVAVLLPRSDTPGKLPPAGSRQLYSPFTAAQS